MQELAPSNIAIKILELIARRWPILLQNIFYNFQTYVLQTTLVHESWVSHQVEPGKGRCTKLAPASEDVVSRIRTCDWFLGYKAATLPMHKVRLRIFL